MRIRALIVDDEPLARDRIRFLLRTEPDVEIVAECTNGKEAVEQIEQQHPDLLFLDVQMPELDGFAVLCSNNGRYLQEVRACLNSDLDGRACNREVLHEECKSDAVIMRPVR